ncbi:MAG: peptide chain release factor N(5)-glutamine methyltransferase, partial [Clostridia bacterium]|nr:peptide chain release factor N(5)-glutamine methyltransferase [Clostridia bacterium]
NVYLVEYFDEALGFLNENRMALSVARSVPAIKGDVLEGYEKFGFLPRPDVIVSNPPYIKKSELAFLQSEVRCEPSTALDGGEDGLVFYRAFAEKWLPFINEKGFIAVECGETQAEKIASLFSKHSSEITVLKDFNGIDRFVIAGKG